MGRRLKKASARLITVKVSMKFPRIVSRLGWNIRFIIARREASSRLDIGPASAVIAVPNSLLSKLLSFIGTGLLHPNLKIIIESAPKGSMWERGFKVNLPSAFAVGSPNLKAAKPWAYSCIVDAINIEGIAKTIQYSVSFVNIIKNYNT